MAIPSRFTKVKIAAGYTLLLVVLLFSLLFVHREMEKLSDTDDVQSLQTDSLLLLLKEKDENTIRMLQIINEANESMITPVELDSIIAEQDTVIAGKIQRRLIPRAGRRRYGRRLGRRLGRGLRAGFRAGFGIGRGRRLRYGGGGLHGVRLCGDDRHDGQRQHARKHEQQRQKAFAHGFLLPVFLWGVR